ncbi:MAG: tetratricopeptide repeat protein [Oligoflexia bacterium]|nr:tetratricopeptide repeat protein [Oligoflexia bacterium]
MARFREEIRVGAAVGAVAFFFSHGLPLWDDDYGVWLAQAESGLLPLLLRILSPLTSDPLAWGYSDRPVQVLLYKLLHLVFGTWGSGYFLVKSLAFGALGGALYHAMRRASVERGIAYLALALFALSTTSLASLLWHSDFAVYSQLVTVVLLLWAVPRIAKGPASPGPAFIRFSLIFFAAVYFGAKLRGDVRLVPLILLAWTWCYRRERFRLYRWPLGTAFLATLPWSAQLFTARPPFLPGATGYQGWTYGTFSLGRVFDFLARDFLSIQRAPLSVLGALGGGVALAGLAYGVYRFSTHLRGKPRKAKASLDLRGAKVPVPDAEWGLLLLWLAFSVLACGILSPQPHAFQLRYTLIPLIPATLLFARTAQVAIEDFSRVRWLKTALLTLVALQCGLHVSRDYRFRADMGHMLVSIDGIYRAVEKNHPDGPFAQGPGFLGYAYKRGVKAFETRRALSSFDEAAQLPANAVIAAWNPPLDPRFSFETVASGCGASLFDLVFRCEPHESGFLLRYLGTVPELAQADQLDKRGSLSGARQVLEDFLRRGPFNPGAGFVLSLYAYRQGDFGRMEQLYEQLGPYFPTNASVLYNWGLAKQGQKKYREAASLLERAYALVPRDYAIGFNLADSYYRQGKKRRALATVQELMETFPNSAPLKNAYQEWSK